MPWGNRCERKRLGHPDMGVTSLGFADRNCSDVRVRVDGVSWRVSRPRAVNPEGFQKLAGGRAQRHHRTRGPQRFPHAGGVPAEQPPARARRLVRCESSVPRRLWHPSGMRGLAISTHRWSALRLTTG
jgi:hypothetical protein